MPFDNVAFTKWLQEFHRMAVESGMPEPQALKYRTEHYNVAVSYFVGGTSAGDAVMRELLG